jgi:hypothetical protein
MSNQNGHKPRKVRKYTDREKAAALAWLDASGQDCLTVSKQLDIPNSTLDEWVKGRKQSADVPKLRNDIKNELRAKLDEMMLKLISVPDANIDKAGLAARYTSFGIAFDKAQLIDGKPTTINETRMSENHIWAEEQLVAMMAQFDIDRAAAIELAKQHAPTVAEWIM